MTSLSFPRRLFSVILGFTFWSVLPLSARCSPSKISNRPVLHKQRLPQTTGLHLDQRANFRKFEVRVYLNPDTGDKELEILKSRKVIYSEWRHHEWGHFHIGCVNPDDPGNVYIPVGRDITGSGKPEVVISNWTGGMHCCFSYQVFELGNHVKKLGSVDAGDGDVCQFIKGGNGKLDFVVNDWTFAYWNASFAESPAPEVILCYGPGGYQPAIKLMRKPAPSPSNFQELIAEGKRQFHSAKTYGPGYVNHAIWAADGANSSYGDWQRYPQSTFWSIMLDLIYSGNMKSAWKFCNEAWRGSPAVKARFLSSFRQQLKKSPYWPAIKAMSERDAKK